MKKVEKLILQKVLQIVQEEMTLSKKLTAIMSFKGIGPVIGIFLLHLFLSYSDANRKQITALCGLDVVTKESGASVRKMSVSPKMVRDSIGERSLWPSWLQQDTIRTSMLFTKDSTKKVNTAVAQIAVMRKMLLIAHVLYKNETIYDPQRRERPLQEEKQAA